MNESMKLMLSRDFRNIWYNSKNIPTIKDNNNNSNHSTEQIKPTYILKHNIYFKINKSIFIQYIGLV